MCGYCSELSGPVPPPPDLSALDSFWQVTPELRGEALLSLLIRLLYGVEEGRLELLRGERLWPAVLGQAPPHRELPPAEHFDFGCCLCSSVLRLHMDLRHYSARWTVLLDHQPR